MFCIFTVICQGALQMLTIQQGWKQAFFVKIKHLQTQGKGKICDEIGLCTKMPRKDYSFMQRRHNDLFGVLPLRFFFNIVKTQSIHFLRGSLTRDFRLQVFFMNDCSPGPQVFRWGRFVFFENSRRYLRMNTVSTAPAINPCHGFSVIFAINSANFRKNLKRSQWDTQGLGDTSLWKKPEVENLVSDYL